MSGTVSVAVVAWRVPRAAGFWLQGVALLAAAGAPAPLYAVHRHRWGLSPIASTVVF